MPWANYDEKQGRILCADGITRRFQFWFFNYLTNQEQVSVVRGFVMERA